VGLRPLPGLRKSRRLRPGISKHLGGRWEDGSTPMWDLLRHLAGCFVGQSPSRGSKRSGIQGGQSLQKKAQKQRGGGLVDGRKAYEDIRGKKREGKGGRGRTKVNSYRPSPPFFGPVGVPAG